MPALIKVKALKDFQDQEGDVKADQELLINDERLRALSSLGRVVVCADQSVPPVEAVPVARKGAAPREG